MRMLAAYLSSFFLVCSFATAGAQSSDYAADEAVKPLPPATHGQPAFSFSGGKRVREQIGQHSGFQEYSRQSANPSLAPASGPGIGPVVGPGTGIVEIAPDGTKTGGKNSGDLVKNGHSALTAPSKPTNVSTKSGAPSSTISRAKPATTVVQILGPDGKLQYKEVPFMGSVSANKRAANITEIKDGEGKVKEYEWAKKGR